MREPQPDQRIQGKTRVSDPTRSIVPVSCPANVLWERKGGRGDDGPGGLEDKKFKSESAAVDGFFPGSAVGRAADPAVPV